jgi:hypothetical protein
MQTYAIIENGTVVNIVDYASQPATPPPGFPEGTIAVAANGAGPGWTYANGALVAPPAADPAPLSLAQQAQMAMGLGFAVTSTGSPSLNATYPVDPQTQALISAELLAVLVNGTFADGTTSLNWPDSTGTLRTFPSVAEFKIFAAACGAYVATLYKVINGTLTSLPPPSVTIA